LIDPAPHGVNAGSAHADQLGVTGGKGRFVGIGVGRYESPKLTELEHAVADVEAVRRLLGDAFVGEPLCDPTEESARTTLQAIEGSMPGGGPLVVLWSGHGFQSPARGVKLMCTDSPRSAARGLDAGSVVEPCAMSGAGQILFIVDTCFSGGAVPDATQVDTPRHRRPSHRRPTMPTSGRDPLKVPVQFWQRPDVTETLEARDIARLFRLLRKYCGASQTRIGTTVGMTQSTVSLIISRNTPVTTIAVLERIADGLGSHLRPGASASVTTYSSIVRATASCSTLSVSRRT
jgi:Helix-turn-helix domain/Caspase domain